MTNAMHIHVASNPGVHEDITQRGYSRRPLAVDEDVAAALQAMAAATSRLPRDTYYEAGERFRTFNRFMAEVLEDGVEVTPAPDGPYVQLKKYNPVLGGQERHYPPLDTAIVHSAGVAKIIAHHVASLPLSHPGAVYDVNFHLKRFLALPGRPCTATPPGLHKDGEKYIATTLVGRCGAVGGEVVITDNKKREVDRFLMREMGECYVLDDDQVWHMLTPVGVVEGNTVGFRDIALLDILPRGWKPS